MGLTIFLSFIGLAVAFLAYVLANFWSEGHSSRNVARQCRTGLGRDERPEVFVVTHPISTSALGGLSVIPFRVRESTVSTRHDSKSGGHSVLEMPPKRASTR